MEAGRSGSFANCGNKQVEEQGLLKRNKFQTKRKVNEWSQVK